MARDRPGRTASRRGIAKLIPLEPSRPLSATFLATRSSVSVEGYYYFDNLSFTASFLLAVCMVAKHFCPCLPLSRYSHDFSALSIYFLALRRPMFVIDRIGKGIICSASLYCFSTGANPPFLGLALRKRRAVMPDRSTILLLL